VNFLHQRHHRRGLSLWLVVALLFMQIATSAYACPGGMFMAAVADGQSASLDDDGDQVAGTAAHHGTGQNAAAAMSPDMVDCDMAAGLDAETPQLCKLHCEPGNQTPLHASASTDAPAAPLLFWAVLDWSATALLPQQLGNTPRLGVASGAPPPGAPPLYLSLLVLRN
jgi:hypothetical protein